MSQFNILPNHEVINFNRPPSFNKQERMNIFALDTRTRKILKGLKRAPANNQEITQIHQEDQDIASMCKLIVQNIVILWNYIELTKIIMRSDTLKEKEKLINNIKEMSIISWQHINMFGIYDFSSLKSKNDPEFAIDEILSYKATG